MKKRSPLVVNAHVLAVIENEWAQMTRNRVIILTTFAPPILFVGLAVTVLILSSFLSHNMTAVQQLSTNMFSRMGPKLPNATQGDALLVTLLNPFLMLFEMLPIVVPLTVASYSIIGEKQNRSLEALLATPIRTWELLVAKSLAAAIPGIAATWCSFAVFVLVAKFTVTPLVFSGLIISPTWITAITLVTPVFTMFAVALGIIISSKSKDPSSAQQLGSLIVLPLVGMMVAQVLGAVSIDATTVLGTALLFGVVDIVLLTLAVRLFRRESILTRWK